MSPTNRRAVSIGEGVGISGWHWPSLDSPFSLLLSWMAGRSGAPSLVAAENAVFSETFRQALLIASQLRSRDGGDVWICAELWRCWTVLYPHCSVVRRMGLHSPMGLLWVPPHGQHKAQWERDNIIHTILLPTLAIILQPSHLMGSALLPCMRLPCSGLGYIAFSGNKKIIKGNGLYFYMILYVIKMVLSPLNF